MAECVAGDAICRARGKQLETTLAPLLFQICYCPMQNSNLLANSTTQVAKFPRFWLITKTMLDPFTGFVECSQ